MYHHKRNKFYRLVSDLRRLEERKTRTPEVILGTVLCRWCKEGFPGLPRSSLSVDSSILGEEEIRKFVEFLKGEDFLEATYWLASAYAQLIAKERRKRLAMYFTPPPLTNRLLDSLSENGVDFARQRFCDPACGGAAFLVPIAMRMRDALRARGAGPKNIINHIRTHLFGFEKDEVLCKLSRHFLLMVLREEIISTDIRPRFYVLLGDSLVQSRNFVGAIDVVVCNPPFRKMTAHEVSLYIQDFKEVIEAQPNIYSLFIKLCVNLVSPFGMCALVTPTSFLSGQYFSKLRAYLRKNATIVSVGLVSDREGVFIDVEQETALTLVKRRGQRPRSETVTKVFKVSRDGNCIDIGKCTLPNAGSVWPIPRAVGDVEILKRAEKSTGSLVGYGYAVRIGGFVWNRDTRTTYMSESTAARAKGRSAVPLLWSSDIAKSGVLRFDGEPKANKEPRFVNLGSKTHPTVVRRPSVILQRVTSNVQPRRLVAAPIPERILRDYGGFVGENHTVVIEQVVSDPVLSPAQLARLLRAVSIDRYFRCISGATNVSAFELCQLRLPDPSVIKKAIAVGQSVEEVVNRHYIEDCKVR